MIDEEALALMMAEQYQVDIHDPEATRQFVADIENMGDTRRMRLGIYAILMTLHDDQYQYINPKLYKSIVTCCLDTYSWAVRAEVVATLKDHMVRFEGCNLESTEKDVLERLSRSEQDLSQLVQVLAGPTLEEKELPQ